MIGQIKRKTERGYGFVLGADKLDYFLHESAFDGDWDKTLEGDIVSFDPAQTTKGLRAKNVKAATTTTAE